MPLNFSDGVGAGSTASDGLSTIRGDAESFGLRGGAELFGFRLLPLKVGAK